MSDNPEVLWTTLDRLTDVVVQRVDGHKAAKQASRVDPHFTYPDCPCDPITLTVHGKETQNAATLTGKIALKGQLLEAVALVDSEVRAMASYHSKS
jgi:hypothetical protein